MWPDGSQSRDPWVWPQLVPVSYSTVEHYVEICIIWGTDPFISPRHKSVDPPVFSGRSIFAPISSPPTRSTGEWFFFWLPSSKLQNLVAISMPEYNSVYCILHLRHLDLFNEGTLEQVVTSGLQSLGTHSSISWDKRGKDLGFLGGGVGQEHAGWSWQGSTHQRSSWGSNTLRSNRIGALCSRLFVNGPNKPVCFITSIFIAEGLPTRCDSIEGSRVCWVTFVWRKSQTFTSVIYFSLNFAVLAEQIIPRLIGNYFGPRAALL